MNSRSNNYGDIIDTEYPFKLKHIRMGTNDRAAQFSAFHNILISPLVAAAGNDS